MAKVNGPLFSIQASGKLASAIVYSKWKGRDYVRQWMIPQNPKTSKQVNVRTALTLLVAAWQGELPAYQLTWDTFADQFNISGFNAYVGRGMLEYIVQLGSSTLPASVSVSGDPPAEVWVWA